MKAKMKKAMTIGGAVLSALNNKEVKDKVSQEIERSRKVAERELAKAKKKMEGAFGKAEKYIKSNPEKAAMMAMGIGAALGSALTLLAKGKVKKPTQKKK